MELNPVQMQQAECVCDKRLHPFSLTQVGLHLLVDAEKSQFLPIKQRSKYRNRRKQDFGGDSS